MAGKYNHYAVVPSLGVVGDQSDGTRDGDIKERKAEKNYFCNPKLGLFSQTDLCFFQRTIFPIRDSKNCSNAATKYYMFVAVTGIAQNSGCKHSLWGPSRIYGYSF